ncbi:uncharacterized protein LAJ45_06079 [Morchella importuna]|uniref:uncharacterized protein n=1 Tax=Morchella importuna TaxID=1174673 RepID=UPI001E8E01E6|nr:uncharacterized protein LAJ45_06079 [Morchella importuna]KAH8149927.1 hypothetical protein LAJ45_06079 [Morchella importuna]
MFISLPSRCEPSARQSIRSPLTPPSVTPPSVSVTGSSTMQCSDSSRHIASTNPASAHSSKDGSLNIEFELSKQLTFVNTT